MLQVLGLGSDAESVYQEMLAGRPRDVVDLCSRLAMTESRVRDALDELVRFDLARASRDTPGLLRAVAPEIGLAALVRREEEELLRRQQELAQNKLRVAEAVATYAQVRDRSTDGVHADRLTGMDAILQRLEHLGDAVTDEVLSVMPGGAQSQASLDASRPLDAAALDRGVEVLTLYQDSVRNDQATFEYARWLTRSGGEVRTAPILPPRLLIFDRTTAVVPIDPANTRAGALCTDDPAIVASLLVVFQQAWDTAVPLGTAQPTDAASGLSSQERELLRLLGTGLTDEAAGSRLGLSGRTVRRQMAALMERLHATSRFEAGLKAAQQGWL